MIRRIAACRMRNCERNCVALNLIEKSAALTVHDHQLHSGSMVPSTSGRMGILCHKWIAKQPKKIAFRGDYTPHFFKVYLEKRKIAQFNNRGSQVS